MNEHENNENKDNVKSVANRIFRLPSSFINPNSSLASTEHTSEGYNSNSIHNQTKNLNEHLENTTFVATDPTNSFQTYSLSNVSDISSVEGAYYLDDDQHSRNQDSLFDKNFNASSNVKFVQEDGMFRISGKMTVKIGGVNSKYKTRIFAFMGVNIFILGIVIGVIYGNPKTSYDIINHNVTTPVTIETTYMDGNDSKAIDLMIRIDELHENGK